MTTSNITPFLWFDDNAEEAVKFYATIFPDARIHNIVRYTEAGPGPAGQVMTIEFELAGQRFVGLNGGPHFKFTEAVSFAVHCDTQEEIDRYWSALTSEGGSESRCGWLKDKFGLSWQIVPREIASLAGNPKVIQGLLTMKKLDIAALKQLADA